MADRPRKEMFRKQALEHLSSPEQLDQLLQVVNRRSWVPILTLAGGLIIAIIWGVVGRIPVTVQGRGMLVYPYQVVSFQSPAEGQILSWNAKPGKKVEKNGLLGVISQPALQQRLDQEQVRLAELKTKSQQFLKLREKRTDLEKQAIERSKFRLSERIAALGRLAESQRTKNATYFSKQDANLARLGAVTGKLGEALAGRYESFLTLKSEGLSSDDVVLEAHRNLIDNEVRMADLELRVHEIELRRIEADAMYQQQMDLITSLEAELNDLDIQLSRIDLLELETSSDNELRILETKRNIARFESELRTKGQIVSEYAGIVLEITAAEGQIVEVGQRLGAIEARVPDSELIAVVYCDIASGKKIEPQMDAHISPDTVQRERYGSMIGTVTSRSKFPVTTDAVTNVVGNPEVARRLTEGRSRIEVRSTLAVDGSTPSGFKWTSGRGPEKTITAGTTIEVRVTVENRRPISYIIPLLRRWSGS